jgi:hypothetical protein
LDYLAYQAKIDNGDLKDNAIKVNRAYFTAKKNIYKSLAVRMTLDATLDATGSSLMRLKYLYANYKFDDFAFFNKPNIEAGIVHTPWLDFEEAINTNRMQGSMFMERNGLFASADFGVTAMANFGGEMDDNYKKKVDGAYAGRYGSIALGVYNGPGYGSKEANNYKTFQARVSFRPIPDIIPGLQVSGLTIMGTGNQLQADTNGIAEWNTNAAMLSFESEMFTGTFQYFTGKGNSSGSISSGKNQATNISGLSLFAMGKMNDWRLIFRYDSFTPNTDNSSDNINNRVILGLGYDLGHSNILILDFDKNFRNNQTGKAVNDDNEVKLTMQVNI